MKAKIFFIFFLLLPLLGFGQTTSSIEIHSGINYSYRHLISFSNDNIHQFIIDSRKDEKGKFNWSFGLAYSKRIKKNVNISLGLSYTRRGFYHEDSTLLTFGSQHDGMGGYIPDSTATPTYFKFQDEFSFIEVPIIGRYEFNHKPFAPFIEFGVAPAYNVNAKRTSIIEKTKTVTYGTVAYRQLNHFQAIGIFAFGFNQQLPLNTQLFGRTTFKYHLTKLMEAPIGNHLFDVAIELGIRKQFN